MELAGAMADGFRARAQRANQVCLEVLRDGDAAALTFQRDRIRVSKARLVCDCTIATPAFRVIFSAPCLWWCPTTESIWYFLLFPLVAVHDGADGRRGSSLPAAP